VLNRPEGRISLTPLEPADVSLMIPQHFSESLLGQSAGEPVPTEVLAEGPLKVPFHDRQRCRSGTEVLSDDGLVPPARVELATFRLGGGCSIH